MTQVQKGHVSAGPIGITDHIDSTVDARGHDAIQCISSPARRAVLHHPNTESVWAAAPIALAGLGSIQPTRDRPARQNPLSTAGGLRR